MNGVNLLSEQRHAIDVRDGYTPAVLVVEDEALIRELVAETLRDAGLSVIEAPDADGALVLLNHFDTVSVLLTDIRMPGSMDGVDLARLVRARRPDIKIVFLSSHIFDPATLTCCDAFVAKPFDTRNLFAQLDHLLPHASSPGVARDRPVVSAPAGPRPAAFRGRPTLQP